MCIKLTPENLNYGPCIAHPTSTYICKVSITLRVWGGFNHSLLWQYKILGMAIAIPLAALPSVLGVHDFPKKKKEKLYIFIIFFL